MSGPSFDLGDWQFILLACLLAVILTLWAMLYIRARLIRERGARAEALEAMSAAARGDGTSDVEFGYMFLPHTPRSSSDKGAPYPLGCVVASQRRSQAPNWSYQASGRFYPFHKHSPCSYTRTQPAIMH